MHKQISILVTLVLLVTTSFADITDKQVKAYLKASGSQAMLDNMKEQIGMMVEQQMMQSGQKVDATALAEIKDVMTRDENFAKFTTHLVKLDENDYKKIMAYYETDLGKKVATIVGTTNLEHMTKELPAFMAGFQKTPPSKKRMDIVKKLIDAMNTTALQEKMVTEMFAAINSALPKEKQMPAAYTASMFQSMKPMIEQQMQISTVFTYQSLSDKELEEMIIHATSKAGNAEVDAIMKGSIDYMSAVMGEMFKALFAKIQTK